MSTSEGNGNGFPLQNGWWFEWENHGKIIWKTMEKPWTKTWKGSGGKDSNSEIDLISGYENGALKL